MRRFFFIGAVCLFCFAPCLFADGLYGDFTNDRIVDANDLREFCTFWLIDDCNLSLKQEDCTVNFYEFSKFADNWMLDVPATPTGLSATPGDTKVLLDWNNNIEGNLAGYNIYRSTTSGSGHTLINSSLHTSSDYNDTNAVNGITYYYVVTAVNTFLNESDDSNEVSATPHHTTPPAAPTGLSATPGDAKILLDWSNNTEGDLAGYNIYRSTTSGSGYTKINTSLRTSSDYNDTTAANGTTYYYVVTAADTASNESGYSSQASATPHHTTPPAAPTGLAATPGNAKVLLDWSNNTEGDLAGYNIYRSTTSGGSYAKINTSLRTSSDYNDTGVTNGTTYYYVVTAVDTATNESDYSSQASATPSGTPPVTAPQNLMVPPMGWDDTQIILIWSKPIDYSLVTDYRVYKDGVALGLSGRFDTTRAKLYYIVTGLTANTTYNFTVKSLNSSGTELAASNVCTKTTTAAPTVLNIANPPYNAVNNGSTKNTAAIQQAINDCPAGGVVLVPAGGTGYLTGGIYLKSNMTLKVDGTLIGDCGHEATDYLQTSLRLPYYKGGNNFMGLVNAYNNYTDPVSAGKPYILENIRICGSGTISGDIHDPGTGNHAHTHVGNNQNNIIGDDTRIGDMITIKGVTNFYLGGWGTGTLTLIRPPEHTMFISYCNGVTVNALNVSTFDLHNGDGLNLATTDTAYIFNSTFDAGDDCINMNAGQGQEGVDENVPVQNVRCFDCTALRGHGGWVIGSFTAAWVQDCVVEDLLINGSEIGIRQKTGSNNGGGGRRNLYRDIRIINVTKQGIFLDSTYDADTYYGNGGAGQFRDNTYKNITVTASVPSIYINGLSGTPHTQNIFTNIAGNNIAYLKSYCTNSSFTNVSVTSWTVGTGCSGNTSSGSPGCPF